MLLAHSSCICVACCSNSFDSPMAFSFQAARPEALHGLAKVCEAASKVTSSSGGAVVAKVAEVLLRQAAFIVHLLFISKS